MATQPTTGQTPPRWYQPSYYYQPATQVNQPPVSVPGTQPSRSWSSFAFAPARLGAEEAAQGIANRLSELFNNHRPEITAQVKDVFTSALIRRAPDKFHRLLHHIQNFLNARSAEDLTQTKRLLEQLTADEIQALLPSINQEGLASLTTLRACLDSNVTALPPNGASAPAFNVTETGASRLREAASILELMIRSHEGALIQTLHTLTQSMNDPDGAISVLRRQINDPQSGIIAESLAILRRDLTSRADPLLRETKTALENYRLGLQSNLHPDQLRNLIRNLNDKLTQLCDRPQLMPQFDQPSMGQVQLFNMSLNVLLQDPNSLTSNRPQQLLRDSEPSLQLLTNVFNAQRGILEAATDIMVEGIGRGLAHFETLPARMAQNMFSIQPPLSTQQQQSSAPTQPIAAASTLISAAAPGEHSFLNLGALMSQGRQFLNSILASASDTASQSAAAALSTLVCSAFIKVREHLTQNTEHQHLTNTINPMIDRLERAKRESSWGQLNIALQEAFRFMQEQQVYFQGLRIPLNPVRTHSSAIPNFLENISAHQNALQPPGQRIPQKISPKMIEEQEGMLKSRLAAYGPTKLIVEYFCGINNSEALLAEIFKISNPSDTDLMPTFRQRLFEKIDTSNLGYLKTLMAKSTYDFLILLSGYYVRSFIDKFLTIPHQWSQDNSKVEVLIKLMRNWLAVTSGAYNSVAATPASQTRDFNTMMEEAMKIPERNGGLNQDELIAAVAKTGLDVFAPRIQWDETIDDYFNAEIPTVSPLYFLNPLVQILNTFCSFGLKAIIFVPQWIGNQILQGGAKIALSNVPFLRDYAEKKIETLRRNTPTSYAVQRMIYRQMQKILALLQRSLNEDSDSATNPLNSNTNVKKVEISGLVEYILEVLGKSQYRTQDRLHNYLQHHAPIRDRMGRELEEAALPEIMESAVTTISLVMQALTGEEEVQQTLYDSLNLANSSFDLNQPVSDEEFAAVEKGIRELTDQILETAIFHAIGEKFDFTNEKQKRGIANFIHNLKEQTLVFTTQLAQKAVEIEHNISLRPTVLIEKISSMIELSTQYNHSRVDALGRADGNRNFHTETKYNLNEICRDLLVHCNPIAEKLNRMKQFADEMVWVEKILKPLMMCHNINHSLNEKFQEESLSSANLEFCKIQLALLQSHLIYLRQNQCPAMITEVIQQCCVGFSTKLKKIEDLQKANMTLLLISPLFERLKQEKQARINLSPSAYLRQLERQILSLTNTLPFPWQKELLNQKLLNLMLAQTPTNFESTATQFSQECIRMSSSNLSETQLQMIGLRQTRDVLQPALFQSIQEFSHLFTGNRDTINHHIGEIKQNTLELNQWSQAQNELPIWNLFLFDMQWITETVKNLAFDRARAKVKQLFEMLYQRHSYVGFLNQIAFIPFLEKFGKHHLKI